MTDQTASGARDDTNPAEAGEAGPSRTKAALTGAAYGMLVLLGFLVGVYGVFYYSLSIRGVPLGAIVAVAVNFVICRGAGAMMRTRLSALAPAVGWLIAVLALSSTRTAGDVLVTDSLEGYLLLFGGAVSAAIGVAVSLVDRTGRRGSGPDRDTSTRG